MVATDHSLQSSYREMVLEHLLVGEILRYAWSHQLPRIELLKGQVDNSGYDIVLESNGIVRHVQLKASHSRAATAGVNINVELAQKPSGCVIWIFFHPTTLAFDRFLWFGGAPGEKLGCLEGFRIGRHSKGNAQGIKAERPAIRVLPRAAFEPLQSIDAVVQRLFGEVPIQGSNDLEEDPKNLP